MCCPELTLADLRSRDHGPCDWKDRPMLPVRLPVGVPCPQRFPVDPPIVQWRGVASVLFPSKPMADPVDQIRPTTLDWCFQSNANAVPKTRHNVRLRSSDAGSTLSRWEIPQLVASAKLARSSWTSSWTKLALRRRDVSADDGVVSSECSFK